MAADPIDLSQACLSQTRAGKAACPLCGRPADPDSRPFCSRRCADIDLSRWLGGVYRVPAEDGEAPEKSVTDDE